MSLQLKRHPYVNLRLMAIDNCLSNDSEWFAEKAYRYYSKTYHTPLHWVKENIIAEEVIKIMMEDDMADLAIEELQEARQKVMADEIVRPFFGPEQVTNIDPESADDEWLLDQMRALKAKEEAAAVKEVKSVEDSLKSLKDASESITSSLSLLAALNKKPEDLDKQIDFGSGE